MTVPSDKTAPAVVDTAMSLAFAKAWSSSPNTGTLDIKVLDAVLNGAGKIKRSQWWSASRRVDGKRR